MTTTPDGGSSLRTSYSLPAGQAAAAVCTPRPCGTAGGLSIYITEGDATIHSDPGDGHPEFEAGGIQLKLRIVNNSTRDEPLLPGYFSLVEATGHAVVASTGAYVRSDTDPTGHGCDWNAPILSAGDTLGPAPICFTVPPSHQSGSLALAYDDTLNPTVTVPFLLTGAPTTRASTAPVANPSQPPPGSGHPAGQYTGTDNGLTVAFTSDGSRITGFTANGGWTCGNGYTAMYFQLPATPVIAADGTFSDTSSGTVNGARLTWRVRGLLSGHGATGTLQVQSSQACELYKTPWTARG